MRAEPRLGRGSARLRLVADHVGLDGQRAPAAEIAGHRTPTAVHVVVPLGYDSCRATFWCLRGGHGRAAAPSALPAVHGRRRGHRRPRAGACRRMAVDPGRASGSRGRQRPSGPSHRSPCSGRPLRARGTCRALGACGTRGAFRRPSIPWRPWRRRHRSPPSGPGFRPGPARRSRPSARCRLRRRPGRSFPWLPPVPAPRPLRRLPGCPAAPAFPSGPSRPWARLRRPAPAHPSRPSLRKRRRRPSVPARPRAQLPPSLLPAPSVRSHRSARPCCSRNRAAPAGRRVPARPSAPARRSRRSRLSHRSAPSGPAARPRP